MRKLLDQSGVIHVIPLLIIVAAVGIITFLLISSTAPINGLFGIINPKPPTNAQVMMSEEDQCKFFTAPGTQAAFCDVFDIKHLGGRAGDLDEARWQYSRVNSNATGPGYAI